jgi:single-stranded DNA-binding protein
MTFRYRRAALVGRLGHHPDIRCRESVQALARLRLATDRLARKTEEGREDAGGARP